MIKSTASFAQDSIQSRDSGWFACVYAFLDGAWDRRVRIWKFIRFRYYVVQMPLQMVLNCLKLDIHVARHRLTCAHAMIQSSPPNKCSPDKNQPQCSKLSVSIKCSGPNRPCTAQIDNHPRPKSACNSSSLRHISLPTRYLIVRS